MAELAITHQVDHDVLAELGAEIDRQLHRVNNRFRVIAVYVQDRRFDHLGHVGAVGRGARILRIGGGEADLVVDDNVHAAAGAITARLRHVQPFHHHALTGKRRITVHEDGQYLRAVGIAAALLPGARGAGCHRVDDFEVRGVERQRQMHRPAGGADIARKAVVILDVAVGQIVSMLAFKLGKQVLGHLAQGVDQHVQTTTVGHGHHNLLHAFAARMLNTFVQRGDIAFAAFKGEALLTYITRVQVLLKTFGRGQTLKDAQALFGAETRLGAGRFKLFLHPALLILIVDVHELCTDRAAIGFAQGLQQVAQRRAFKAEESVGGGIDIGLIGLSEIVERRIQFGDHRAFATLERIKIGPAIAQRAIRGNKRLDKNLLARGGGIASAHLLGHQGAGFGALRQRLHYRQMSDVRGLRIAVGGRQGLHIVEIFAPGVGNRCGVIEIVLVQLFHIRGITAEQIRVRLKRLHHERITLKNEFLVKEQGTGNRRSRTLHAFDKAILGWHTAIRLSERCARTGNK